MASTADWAVEKKVKSEAEQCFQHIIALDDFAHRGNTHELAICTHDARLRIFVNWLQKHYSALSSTKKKEFITRIGTLLFEVFLTKTSQAHDIAHAMKVIEFLSSKLNETD